MVGAPLRSPGLGGVEVAEPSFLEVADLDGSADPVEDVDPIDGVAAAVEQEQVGDRLAVGVAEDLRRPGLLRTYTWATGAPAVSAWNAMTSAAKPVAASSSRRAPLRSCPSRPSLTLPATAAAVRSTPSSPRPGTGT